MIVAACLCTLELLYERNFTHISMIRSLFTGSHKANYELVYTSQYCNGGTKHLSQLDGSDLESCYKKVRDETTCGDYFHYSIRGCTCVLSAAAGGNNPLCTSRWGNGHYDVYRVTGIITIAPTNTAAKLVPSTTTKGCIMSIYIIKILTFLSIRT